MSIIPDYSHADVVIKSAVEQSRYRALQAGNAELLSLYYGSNKCIEYNWSNTCINICIFRSS